MSRVLHYRITEGDAGLSVLGFLKKKGYSRHVLHTMKAHTEAITLNGSRAYMSRLLCVGDMLTVRLPAEEPSSVLPADLPLSLLYEDEDILVVNKPADMPIHPSMDNHDNTLANALAWHFREQGTACACRIINRLDRDTSGLLLAARHLLSAAVLAADRPGGRPDIHRIYLAIVSGELAGEGIVDAPIGRAPGSVIARCVDREHGEPAVTHYRSLASKDGLSLVQLRLETGRTHQIRVHMKHLGHPLIGDFLYNPDYSLIRRQALHSFGLSFRHPITGEQLSFTCPPPEDMQRIMDEAFRSYSLSDILSNPWSHR